MNKKHKKEVIVVLSILACVLMCGVEKILQPNFFHKSLYKILIFSLSVLLYALYAKEKIKIFAWKEINKKFLRKILGLVFFHLCGHFDRIRSYSTSCGKSRKNCVEYF